MSQGRLLKPLLVSRQAPLMAEQTAAPEVWDPWAADTSLHPTVSGAQALSPCGHLYSDPSHAQGWLYAGLGYLGVVGWGVVNTRPGSSSLGEWERKDRRGLGRKQGCPSGPELWGREGAAGPGRTGRRGVDAPCVMCGAELESRRQAPCASPGLGRGEVTGLRGVLNSTGRALS